MMYKALLLTTCAALMPVAAQAQVSTAPQAGAAAQDEASSEGSPGDIIVTGTSLQRQAMNTPLAAVKIDESRLRAVSASSQADILATVPSIKSDAGGGELVSNVFVRGLPSVGGYQFTPLLYDGIPAATVNGMTSSTPDIFVRNDANIAGMEFVRGGVSNLFGPGSVVGLINYISKTGTDETHGSAQLEWAERGRMRADVSLNGPIAENLYYAVAGWYRYDRGPLDTGLDTDGYQIRGNLRYKFPDSSGSVTLYGQYIDDQVQFYQPFPLDGVTRRPTPGNDGEDVLSVQTDRASRLSFLTPAGLYRTHVANGATAKGGAIALAFEKEFGDGWGINGRAKYSKYKHRFDLFLDGDGVVNAPESLQGFLTNRGLGSLANASFTFADSGGVVPGNTLLFANRFLDRDRPFKDATIELNLTKSLETGSLMHNFTLGGFYATTSIEDFNTGGSFLGELNNRGRLINVTVTNPDTGVATAITRDGLLDAGVAYTNAFFKAKRYAGYFADQVEAGRFQFDIGARIEKQTGFVRRENSATVVTDATTPNISTALRNVLWGTGVFLTGKPSATSWAGAAGVLYKVSDSVSLYANASRGYFFPELRAVTFNVLGQPSSYSAEIIKQAEVGVKFDFGAVSGSIDAFYNTLKNRRQVLFVNDGAGGVTERINQVGTETKGFDATVAVRILQGLRFEGNLTYQDGTYTAFDTTPANVGNLVERQPKWLYNAGIYYDSDHVDVSFFGNHTGDLYTASNNTIRLQSYTIYNLDAGVKTELSGATVRLGVNVFNLFNDDSVTEGSPRQDNAQSAGGAFFVGRPVLPRRISARLSVTF